MYRRRWFLALTPVVIQSVMLFLLSPRFASYAGRFIAVVIGIAGTAGAFALFVMADSTGHKQGEEEGTWIEQMTFLLRKRRHDILNDIQVLGGLVQLGDTHRALDYLRHMGQRLDSENEIHKSLDDRIALAVLTGQAIASCDGTEMAVEIDKMDSRAPACRGLAESLERVIAYLSATCEKAHSGRLYLRCLQKGERWQIRLACTSPVTSAQMEALIRDERGGGDYNIRYTEEADRGPVIIYDFPRRVQR